MKRIVCYGDSNTFGYAPDRGGLRYGADERWTGVMAKILGPEYEVIEEGLNGRTTVFDDPTERGRNGLTYLRPCLMSHRPFELLIIMLGTNDIKSRFGLTPCDLAATMRTLLNEARAVPFEPMYRRPEILVVSPVLLKPLVENGPYDAFAENARDLSASFALQYGAAARDCGAHFFDASRAAEPSSFDGVHMDAENHRRLGEALAAKCRDILG